MTAPPATHGAESPGRTEQAWWTGVIGAGLRAMLHRRIGHLSELRARAAGLQSEQLRQLRRLLATAQHTEFGRTHGFAGLLRRADVDMLRGYRDAVPPADYEAFRAMAARMREHAEPDVLWPGVVRHWAQTSGTTGGQKYIPVSGAMMKSNHVAALDVFAHSARFGCSLADMFKGRLLFLGGSTNVSVNEHGIRTGDLSGLVTDLIRWPLTEAYSPGAQIALMDHWPSKIDAMARLCAHQDIRFVSGMASWTLVLFEKMLEFARRERSAVRCVRDVWPNLRMLIHGGVKYAPFDPRVREAWSGDATVDVPRRLEVYPASEGFIAVQDTPGDPGLRLHVDTGIFFEFVPVEEAETPGQRGFAAWEVEKGQRYVVCMTTCAGLWRYIIGDVVEFDTIPPDGPARLRIVGRHRHFINAFGENLIAEEIENAVVRAMHAAGVRIGEFTAAPVYPAAGRRAGLELAVEFDPASTGHDRLRNFTDEFDRALRAANVDYDTKRTGDLGMAPPTVTALPMGAFHRWMESRGKLGGQHKAPRCANHREFVDSLVGTP